MYLLCYSLSVGSSRSCTSCDYFSDCSVGYQLTIKEVQKFIKSVELTFHASYLVASLPVEELSICTIFLG